MQYESQQLEIRVTCMPYGWTSLHLLYGEWWSPTVIDALVNPEPCGRVQLHAPNMLAGYGGIGERIRAQDPIWFVMKTTDNRMGHPSRYGL